MQRGGEQQCLVQIVGTKALSHSRILSRNTLWKTCYLDTSVPESISDRLLVKVDSTWEDRASKAVLLIRVLVGWVFLSEGIQKFLFPDSLGVGRFVKIGIPWPQVMAPFVGVVEIVCGSLLATAEMQWRSPEPIECDFSPMSAGLIFIGRDAERRWRWEQ
jgi:hypothetical protein